MGFPVSCSGEVFLLTSHHEFHVHTNKKKLPSLTYKQKLILNG